MAENMSSISATSIKASGRLKEPQLYMLIEKVQEAIEKGKYLIHLGI